MHNKQLTEKKYFDLITIGHYIDVQNSEGQWVMARVLEKDKKYLWVAYDGFMKKQDQFFVNSYRVAPLRLHTEGFTGSYMKIYRNNMPRVEDLKNYVQIAQQKFFSEKAKAFEITQLLRGQLFVYVHDLLCRQISLNEQQCDEANKFLDIFINFLMNLIIKAIEYQEEYFTSPISTNKLLYLTNSKIAIVQSLQQMLILLQLIVKADAFKYVNLWKYNKQITPQEKLSEDFQKKKGLIKLYEIFIANDKKGFWYPSSTRKSIYKILLKYSLSKTNYVMPQMPKYLVRDYQQFYSILPFMWRCSPDLQLQNQFVDFSINILLTNSPFDAKLKSIQELKKILEGKNRFQFLDQKKVLTKIDQMGVLEQLLDNKNFNPEVFKRFIPILNFLCKIRNLSLKNIQSLFQIVKFRHESETGIIFDIISEISQFAPSSLLDNVYTEICKIDINSEQTMKFIKTFTIKAVQNLSKEKSILSGFFGKKKGGSSKYGYYGLNILYKESHDDGRITREKVLFALNIIKELLSENSLKQERWNHLNYCVDFIKARKNFGQSLKLIGLILSTFDETNYFGEDKKKVVDKLEAKYNLIDLIVVGFKNIETIPQIKFTHQQCYQFFYDLIQAFSPYVKIPLTINQIEFLWYKCDSASLLNFLRKSRPNEKFKKLLSPEVIEEIFTVIFRKPSFYKRNLTFQQFETIYELFLSYHLEKGNIVMNSKDSLVRYNKPNLLGMDYFVNFLENCKDYQNFEKVSRKTIQIILRPNPNKNVQLDAIIQHKVLVWKDLFKRCIQRLSSNPENCLTFIKQFYSLIEGRFFKEIRTDDTSNRQILVEFNSMEKVISIQRFCTIFRLRKLIKDKFRIDCDFNMLNVKMNKVISFQEEEDFSVNAMPLMDNGRSASISIQLKNNKYHQQQLACYLFKKQIEKQEKLYSMIFKIIEEKDLQPQIQLKFWKTIELLPLNKVMMAEVQKCDQFTLEKWMNYFQTASDNSLQYKLSIVLNLLKSQKWALKMEQNHGLLALILTFMKILQKWNFQFENEALLVKILDVIQKIYEKCPKKNLQNDLLKEMNQDLIKALQTEFSQSSQEDLSKSEQNRISLNLINKILSIYLSNLKILTDKKVENIENMKLSTCMKVLEFGMFMKKNEASVKFAEQITISLSHTLYENPNDKKKILEFLMNHLVLQNLIRKERTQSYFRFIITVLHSFEETPKTNQQSEQSIKESLITILPSLEHIKKFIYDVLICQNINDDEKAQQQIQYGSLTLLKFMLKKSIEGFDIDVKNIFIKLIESFLFPSNQSCSKRLKSDKNKKILFEILKKISFQNPQILSLMTQKLIPFLQKSKFRKNSILNWNLHFENSEKKLFVGLQNLGATCYINCLFQQLFMIDSFRESFMSIESRSFKPDLEKNEIYQLQKIFYALKYGNRKAQTTKNFCSSFITFQGQPISPVVQSDADEFFNTLMDRIQTFLKMTSHHDILEKTFQGKLSNQLNCEGCPHRSEKIEPFMSIGVNLKNKKTLEEALKGYVEGEILDGDNAYYCEPCDKKVRTMKRLCIKQLPNILVIVLKRFEYDFDTYKKIKINSYLEFPQKLNMTEYTSEYLQSKSLEKVEAPNSQNPKDQNNIFHLRGTVIHAGYADAGHYYSFIKNSGNWYEFNDEFIREINYSKIQEEGFGGDDKESSDELKIEKYKNAYILFYERETPQNMEHIQKQKIEESLILQEKENSHETSVASFSKDMTDQILGQNYEASIFSSLMDQNFINFWENLSILENPFIRKFLLLYFHTVIMRDKLKYEYATNYFRIVSKYLSQPSEGQQENKKSDLAEWFLQQINKTYIKEFLIEGPKTARFVFVSLVLTAIHHAQNIPENLLLALISSLKKTGMSPFGQLFKALLKRKETQKKLKELKFYEILTDLLFNQKKVQQLPKLQMEVEGYFGAECSEGQIEKQKCSGALLECLENYEGLTVEMALKVNESYSFRKTNKIFLRKIAQLLCKGVEDQTKNQTDIISFVKMFEERITSTNCGRQFVEKYLFFMRYLIWECEKTKLKEQIYEIVVISFQSFILGYSRNYEAMDWIIRELTKIAQKSLGFRKIWRNKVQSNSHLKLEIQSWLKQIEKPQYVNLKDDFFEKLRSMDLNEKSQYLKRYSKKMKFKTIWMLTLTNEQSLEYDESDLQNVKENETIQIKNKVFILREKFGEGILYLASYAQKEDQSIWIYLQKNEIETVNNL